MFFYLLLIFETSIKKSSRFRGARVAKSLTLDVSSGLDLRVMNSSSMLGSMLSLEPIKKKNLG